MCIKRRPLRKPSTQELTGGVPIIARHVVTETMTGETKHIRTQRNLISDIRLAGRNTLSKRPFTLTHMKAYRLHQMRSKDNTHCRRSGSARITGAQTWLVHRPADATLSVPGSGTVPSIPSWRVSRLKWHRGPPSTEIWSCCTPGSFGL